MGHPLNLYYCWLWLSYNCKTNATLFVAVSYNYRTNATLILISYSYSTTVTTNVTFGTVKNMKIHLAYN